MEKKMYPYRPKMGFGLILMVIFGIGAFLFLLKARHNDQGLIINGAIQLSLQAATYFYWAGFAFTLLLVLLVAYIFFWHCRGWHVALTATSLVALDKGTKIDIPYEDIRSFESLELNSQRMLHVVYAGGTVFISQSMLPSKEAFDEVCALLAARVCV